MADVAFAVRAYLLTKTAITDLVGQRIYTDQLPQNPTLPAIVMFKRYTQHEHALSDLAGLASANIQFECFATTRSVANSIADAIIDCGIITHKGTQSSVDIRGVRVSQGQMNDVVAPLDGSDERYYMTVIELEVDYTET